MKSWWYNPLSWTTINGYQGWLTAYALFWSFLFLPVLFGFVLNCIWRLMQQYLYRCSNLVSQDEEEIRVTITNISKAREFKEARPMRLQGILVLLWMNHPPCEFILDKVFPFSFLIFCLLRRIFNALGIWETKLSCWCY